MSNVVLLHPANAERARALISSVPAPNAPIDLAAVTRELPGYLAYALALLLEDLEADPAPRAGSVKAVRLLAAIANRYQLENNRV